LLVSVGAFLIFLGGIAPMFFSSQSELISFELLGGHFFLRRRVQCLVTKSDGVFIVVKGGVILLLILGGNGYYNNSQLCFAIVTKTTTMMNKNEGK
jgi:hypothetical protein